MEYKDYLPVMRNAYDMLCVLPASDPELGGLVREGLLHVIRNCAAFDACRDQQLPFTKHFLRLLTVLPLSDEGHWLEIFEDLALIVREKQLRCGGKAFAAIEERILRYFEASGYWDEDDGRLVSQWYWHRLPLRRTNIAYFRDAAPAARRDFRNVPDSADEWLSERHV